MAALTPSPADRQVEALNDLKRIERAFNETYERVHGDTIEFDSGPILAELLAKDVIRVGHRPSMERPMEGQLSIEDEE